MKRGIDVSKYQGDIDWRAVKADGIEFAMIRAGYVADGKMVVDERFHTNMTGAGDAGVDVGVYIYSYATNEGQAKLEATLLDQLLERYHGKITYPIAWDIEDEKWQGSLGNEVRTAMAKAFCEEMEKKGYYVSIYANLNWVQNKLNWAELTAYDLWLAQWAEAPTDRYAFGMWQYSNKGSVAGIFGRVDMNQAYKDYPALIKNGGLNGFGTETEAPAPEPAPEPAPAPGPEGPASGLKVGETVAYSGPLYTDSYGGGKGKTVSGSYRVSRIVAGRRCGVLLNDGLGWVPEEDCRRAEEENAPAPILRLGAKVRYSGPLYTDSYGGGKGKTVNGTYTVSRIVVGRRCGVLLNGGLGWVPAGECQVIG